MKTRIYAHEIDMTRVAKKVGESLARAGIEQPAMNNHIQITTRRVGWYEYFIVQGREDTKKWFSTGIEILRRSWRTKDAPDAIVDFPADLDARLTSFALYQAERRAERHSRWLKDRQDRESRYEARRNALESIGLKPTVMIGPRVTFYTERAKVSLRFEYDKEGMEQLLAVRDALAPLGINVLEGVER